MHDFGGTMAGRGGLGLTVRRARGRVLPARPASLKRIVYEGWPREDLPEAVRQWRARNVMHHLWRGIRPWLIARTSGALFLQPMLYLVKFPARGFETEYGLVSLRAITDTGVAYIVDAFQNLVEVENMKHHALGTGSTGDVATQAALITEWTSSEYATRAVGSTTEGASANIYRSVGTNTKANAGSSNVTEHGIFSTATLGAGVMLDRSVFGAIALAQNDSLQSTWDFSLVSGG